jgi:Protein of unknown function (DUF2867)
MRLPDTAHTSRPWRIYELTAGFRLEDVWALPTPGGPGDFPRLVRLMASGDPSRTSSGPARLLWAIRWKIGALLGWDSPSPGPGPDRPTLRDRLPSDLRDASSGPEFDVLPFTSLYLTDDEWAAEVVNRTVHGVMHIAWVPDQAGGYRGQMAVYVKPRGRLGTRYLAAIAPFRHLIVYPPMLREIGRRWQALDADPTPDDLDAAAGGRVRQVTLPPCTRALSTFARVDYQDAFVVATGPEQDRTAEQWARVLLEDAPASTRSSLSRGWSRLGLRLGSAPPDRSVLGWEIRRSTPDVALLGAEGRFGLSGELLFERRPRTLLCATFVHLENPVARGLWTAIESRHRQVVRDLLEQASGPGRP